MTCGGLNNSVILKITFQMDKMAIEEDRFFFQYFSGANRKI